MQPVKSQLLMESQQKFKCLVVDDEPPAREVIRRYIEQIPFLEMAGECSNALQVITLLRQQQIDLLFLDIQLPQMSGMDLIRTLQHPPKIVLTTAYDQYAVQAFELAVVDYLVKPIQFDRFLKSVMKALPEKEAPITAEPGASANRGFLYFRADRKMVKVFLSDICYVESLKDYVKIHTVKGPIITKYALVALEAMLPAAAFLRVHRSYIVAVDKIESLTTEEIQIAGDLVPIGKLFRQQVFKTLDMEA